MNHAILPTSRALYKSLFSTFILLILTSVTPNFVGSKLINEAQGIVTAPDQEAGGVGPFPGH